MTLDRERFLVLALGMSACAGKQAAVEEGMPRSAFDRPSCVGIDLMVDPPKCVAWAGGKRAAGYTPTDECVRWDDDYTNCTAFEYVSGAEDPFEDRDCTGFDMEPYPPKCVAWQDGRLTRGYEPTRECVRWDYPGGRCDAMQFDKAGAVERGD